jgi:4-amino-4-deoxy-L-arabinose transferase-like glycosyltransferase
LNLRNDYFLSLLFLTLFLFFLGIGARDFWAPVEPRYAEIVRVMFAKDQWIVPTVNGALYTDKPILFFWLALLGSKVFGAVSEWTVRLPAALGGVGFVFGTYVLGRDFFTRRAGWIAGAVLATSMRVLWEARWAHVDTLFCAAFIFAIYFIARALFHKGSPYEILLAYPLMALAVLTKGLIGVVLPGLLLLALMLARRDWRLVFRLKLHLGVPIFLLVAAPWFFLVARATDGRWLADFIYIHHIQRYTAGAGHRQSFYYYLTTLPADFLPWTIFLIPALAAYRSYRRYWAEPTTQFFILWFVSVFLFFTLSNTKRDLYLLPLMPTLALFVGKYFDDFATGKIAAGTLYRWTAAGLFAFAALAGIAAAPTAWLIQRSALISALAAALPLLLGGASVVWYVRRDRPLAVVGSVVAMMALTVVSAALWIMPYLENFKSPRSFAQQVNEMVPASAPVYIYADTMNDFNFYTKREVMPVLTSPPALAALLARSEHAYLLVKERDLRRLPRLSRGWIIASEARNNATWHLLQIGARDDRPRAKPEESTQ